MKQSLVLTIVMLCLIASSSAQTIILTDNDNSAPPIVVELGSTLTILRGDCPISEETDENFIVIDVLPPEGENPDQLDPIDISSGTATVVLPALGEYVISCGCPALPGGSGFPFTCAPAGNVTVVEPAAAAPIPTLGQWGIIISGTLLVILGLTAIKQHQASPGFNNK